MFVKMLMPIISQRHNVNGRSESNCDVRSVDLFHWRGLSCFTLALTSFHLRCKFISSRMEIEHEVRNFPMNVGTSHIGINTHAGTLRLSCGTVICDQVIPSPATSTLVPHTHTSFLHSDRHWFLAIVPSLYCENIQDQ